MNHTSSHIKYDLYVHIRMLSQRQYTDIIYIIEFTFTIMSIPSPPSLPVTAHCMMSLETLHKLYTLRLWWLASKRIADKMLILVGMYVLLWS